jgi:hypothetical protein
MKETVADKACRIFMTDHWRLNLTDTTPHRLSIDVLGDSADPMRPEPYRVVISWLESGRAESCTCANPKTNCSHLALARKLEKGLGIPRPR